MGKLKHMTWYWLSVASEGDIFYPVFVVDHETLKVDGINEKIADYSGATFNEAFSPINIELMKEKAAEEMQASYDSHMYNASGDDSTPLIELESAKCALEHIGA